MLVSSSSRRSSGIRSRSLMKELGALLPKPPSDDRPSDEPVGQLGNAQDRAWLEGEL